MDHTPFNIEAIIDQIIIVEGGFTDHPDDKGGPTCWGITEKVARAYDYTGPMQDLPKSIARQIYNHVYYLKPKLDLLYPLSHQVTEEVMDTGVNCGSGTAIKMLQTALNVLNDSERLYKDIQVDGLLGEGSATALRKFLEARGEDGETVLLKCLNCLQGVRYMELCARREKNESFLYGWMKNRVT